jgi:hypothetical protein
MPFSKLWVETHLSIDVAGRPNQIHRVIQGDFQETPRGPPLHQVLPGGYILLRICPLLMLLRVLDFRYSSGKSIGGSRLV